jgi:4-amino-4-deoxy-L-arabinose transferase-like glycosyltransferase
MHVLVEFLTKKGGGVAKDIAALFFVFATAFFLFLGRLPLLEPDEGRYAEIPREMLELGDFITPHLNYVKYFEKPPLHYWLNALSFTLFGRNEFAARLPAALLGLCGVLLVYHVGRRLFGRREGLFAALVLGSSLGYLLLGRMNIIDMTLSFCMTATLGFFLLAVQEGERRKGLYYHLFYLFAALTVLAKGLIGIVLPGGVIFFFLLITRRWRVLREMRLLTGSLLFLLVCAPWFILVSLKNPEFPRFFFIHEHFERFLTKVHGRYEPPWFFLPVLLVGMLPWIFFLPEVVRNLRRDWDSRKVFLVLWASVIFVFFSLSDSKLIPYILPVFPAIALLVGCALSDALGREDRGVRYQAVAAIAFLLIAGAGFLLYRFFAATPKISLLGAQLLGGIFFSGALLSLLALRTRNRVLLLLAFCLTGCLAGMSGLPVIFARQVEKKSTKVLARVVRERFRDVPTLVSYGNYRQDLPFYSGRRVIVAGNWGELEFGRTQESRQGWFLHLQAFNALWDSSEHVVTLMSRDDLARFRPVVKTPVTVVSGWGKTVLVSNRRQ